MSDSFELDLAAAGLRADARDTPALLEGLARWLETSVPDLVSVERKRAGLFDSRRQVTRITCRVGEESYVLEPDGARASARRARVVRGITLKTETLAVHDWLVALGGALQEQAVLSEASVSALRSLLR